MVGMSTMRDSVSTPAVKRAATMTPRMSAVPSDQTAAVVMTAMKIRRGMPVRTI